MTMPTKMNCPHIGDGWCMECVEKLNAEIERLKGELAKYDKNAPLEIKTGSFADVSAAIRALPGGNAWDKIEDPTAYIREMRGGLPAGAVVSTHYIVRRKSDGKWLQIPSVDDSWWSRHRMDAAEFPNTDSVWKWFTVFENQTPYDLMEVAVTTTERVVTEGANQ